MGEAVEAECVAFDNAMDSNPLECGVVEEGIKGSGEQVGEAGEPLGGAGWRGGDGSGVGGGGNSGGMVKEVDGGEDSRLETDLSETSDKIESNNPHIKHVCANTARRKEKLDRLLSDVGTALCWQDRDYLQQLLLGHYQAFAVEDGDRGETGLIQINIDNGDALPCRQPVCPTPFAPHHSPSGQKWHANFVKCSPRES